MVFKFSIIEVTMEANFPSNSLRVRQDPEPDEEPKEKVLKVVTNGVIQRKKPLGKRVVDMFFKTDGKSLGEYLRDEVLVPAFRDMVTDAITQGAERMFYGDSRGSRRGRSDTGHTRYSNRYSANPARSAIRDEPRTMSRRARVIHDFDEIILATRAEAQDVLEHLALLIDKYESASVADLYDMVGVTGSFADRQYGWTDLEGTDIAKIRAGYLLNLPEPDLLKK